MNVIFMMRRWNHNDPDYEKSDVAETDGGDDDDADNIIEVNVEIKQLGKDEVTFPVNDENKQLELGENKSSED